MKYTSIFVLAIVSCFLLLELPIPTFDREIKAHAKLAELGGLAREEAAKLLKSGEFPVDSSIARQRAFVRTHFST